jgi:tetratricopeptide (TPR) repeat protein
MDESALQRMMETLREFTKTQNWEEVRRSLQTHPELLSRGSIAVFGEVIAQLEQQGQFKSAKAFRWYYDILLRARKVGIEKAIAEARGDSSEAVSPELRAILSKLFQPEPPPELIPQRIQLIYQALGFTSLEKNPALLGRLQGLLGNSLRKNPKGDRAENIERAIEAYRQAALLLSKEMEPVLWAINMNNLAKTYLQRVHGNRKENLEHAVVAFRQALGILTGWFETMNLDPDSEEMLVKLSMGSPEDLDSAIDYLDKILQPLFRAWGTLKSMAQKKAER